jgi:integrase
LGRFAVGFQDTLATMVETRQIEDWVHSLKVGNETKNNYLKVLKAMFAFAQKRNYLDSNPALRIERLTVSTKQPSILTPREMKSLLAAVPDCLIPYVTIGAFAGLRTSELEALDWSQIDLPGRTIEATADRAKTHRRLVDISGSLYEWLLPFSKKNGPIRPVNCRKLLTAAWSQVFPGRSRKNDFRHSCASYHLAFHENIELTTLQLGHSKATLFRYYRKIVKRPQAKIWYSIKPPASENIVTLPLSKKKA